MLNKENIYMSLEGKSKEELTELYWLLKNNNEKLFHNDLSVFIEEYYKTNIFLEYYNQRWGGGDNLKTEVTLKQLKEILQPMEDTEFDLTKTIVTVSNKEEALKLREYALKKGFKETSGLNLNHWGCNKTFSFLINKEIVTSNIYKEEQGLIEYSFNDIFKTEPTLQQQLEKAEAEVKRLKEAIEDSEIKVGDWVVVKESETFFKVKGIDLKFIDSRCKKITNPQLIELLENESK